MDSHEDGINATFHFEFQFDISIMAIVNEELETRWKQKNRPTLKMILSPTVFQVKTWMIVWT